MNARTRIHVDRDACAGSGICAGIVPTYFEVRGHVAHVLREQLDDDHPDMEAVRDAAECCPMEAILLTPIPESATG